MNREQKMQFEGKTVDHAIELACEELHCSKEDLEITIITKGSTGLFGLGGKKAKIEVTLRPEALEGGRTGVKLEEGPEESPAPSSAPQGPEEEAHAGGGEPEGAAVSSPERYSPPPEDGQGEEAESSRPGEPEPVPPEFLEKARRFLEELLQRAGLETEISVDPQDPQFPIRMEGGDASLIIGREGQTLDALEYLVNRAVHRMSNDFGPQVHLDAGGYRLKRMESLRQTALRTAKKVRSTGRQVVLPPMSPRDRRVVHLTLKGFNGVTTRSVGDGDRKRVAILPKRRRGRGPRPRRHG